MGFPRSKSELAVPTISSMPHLEKLPSSASEVSLRPMSRDTRSSSVSSWRDETPSQFAKSIINRSSRLLHRPKNSSRARTREWLAEGTEYINRDVQELSSRGNTKRSRGGSEGTCTLILLKLQSLANIEIDLPFKQTISEPFNFQHLTHTGPNQAKALRSASHQDLVTEFSAMRASQAPRSMLKGIKTDSIQNIVSPSTSSVNSPIASPDSPSASRPPSVLGSPTRDDARSLRTVKSVDSFTRLASKSFSTRSPPFPPPPRLSSRKSMSMSKIMVVTPQSTIQESPTVPDSSFSSYFTDPFAAKNDTGDEAGTQSPMEIAQAVTTPDDSACLLLTRSLASSIVDLEDVPEDGEVSTWAAGSKIASGANSPSVPRSPISKRYSRQFETLPQISSSTTSGACATASDPTLPSGQPQTEDIPLRVSRRISYAPKFGHHSWEDDIDYCYEHAMEASCDAEYDDFCDEHKERAVPEQRATQSEEYGAARPEPRYSESPYTKLFALETEPNSATSSSASAPGLTTPSDVGPSPHTTLAAPRDSGAILFPLSPSLLIPKDYPTSRVTHEEHYAQRLSGAGAEVEAIEGSKPQPQQQQRAFGCFAPPLDAIGAPSRRRRDVDASSSQRSSLSPLSKSPSRDTLLIRSGNTSSVGSVPELVPSTRSSGASGQLDRQAAAALRAGAERETLETIPSPALAPETEAATSPADKPAPESKTALIPLVLPQRTRSTSESAGRLLELVARPSQVETPATTAAPRLRSMSSTGNLVLSTRGRASGNLVLSTRGRASYTLFPPAATMAR